jgi:hypothetical protein
MNRVDTQPGSRTVRTGDVVICSTDSTPADKDLPSSGVVIAIQRSAVAEHDEYVVQVGPNLLGIYRIEQLACPATEEEPLHSVHTSPL